MAPTDARSAIAAVNEQFAAALIQQNAAGVAALYTEDAQLLPPNMDVMTGRGAIQAFWQGALGMGITGGELTSTEVFDHGETAVELGRYVLSGAEGQLLDQGKYIVVWKLEGDQYRLHRDIYNSSLPPAGA